MTWILLDLAIALVSLAVLAVLVLGLWRRVKALGRTVTLAGETVGRATDALAQAQATGPLGAPPSSTPTSSTPTSSTPLSGRRVDVPTRSRRTPHGQPDRRSLTRVVPVQRSPSVNLPGGWELVLVVLVIMVLFGAKRLPEASRSLGRSLRIFKAETKGLRDDDKVGAYDQAAHDRAVYDRTIAAQPPVPPVPGVPPAPGTDPRLP